MDQNKLNNDICVCESEGCGDCKLKHFEECQKCGSTAYHRTIHAYVEDVKGGKE